VAWSGVEGWEGQLADEEVLGEGVVEQAPAGTQHGLAVAKDIPSQAGTRPKVVEVTRIELADWLCSLRGGVKEAEAVFFLAYHAVVIPAQPEVESQARHQLPIVLEVEAVIVFEVIAVRIT